MYITDIHMHIMNTHTHTHTYISAVDTPSYNSSKY